MEKCKISKSPEDTFNIGFELGASIKNIPLLIGLTGEMGSGKTVFAKGLAEGLGVKELITSPTFLGISECYSGRLPFIHMDFYKKVSTQEIIDFYLKKNSVILIEWIENFSLVFTNKPLKPDIRVYIQFIKDKTGSYFENERQIMLY